MTISIDSKKSCLHWFLNRYKVKQREVVYLLHYVMREDDLLESVHFVYDVQYAKRGWLISAEGAKKPGFKFYNNQLVTTDVDKAFHDVRLNKGEPLYIELSFDGVKRSLDYHRVLEDNPFIPDDYYVQEQDRRAMEDLLDTTLKSGYESWLRKEIDRCLDEGNDEQFNVLSLQLQRYLIEKMMPLPHVQSMKKK